MFKGLGKKMPDYVRGIFNYFIVKYLTQIFMDKAIYTIYVNSITPTYRGALLPKPNPVI